MIWHEVFWAKVSGMSNIMSCKLPIKHCSIIHRLWCVRVCWGAGDRRGDQTDNAAWAQKNSNV